MRIVYTDGTFRPVRAPILPGEETRRVPVVVIRNGASERASAVNDAVPPGNHHHNSTGIDVAGTDYRLTLSPEALARDREVRGHERDHLVTLGGYVASAVSYTTRTGADGESVAVGGRIAVDLTEVPGNPRATLRKARTIYAAATAPGDPSAADLRVASEAYRLMRKADDQLASERSQAVSISA